MDYSVILHNDEGRQFECVPYSNLDRAYEVANSWFDGNNGINRYEIFELNDDGTLGRLVDQRED
jgi:hypothetical protein